MSGGIQIFYLLRISGSQFLVDMKWRRIICCASHRDPHRGFFAKSARTSPPYCSTRVPLIFKLFIFLLLLYLRSIAILILTLETPIFVRRCTDDLNILLRTSGSVFLVDLRRRRIVSCAAHRAFLAKTARASPPFWHRRVRRCC